jgi:hypothetical protein
MGRVPNPYVSTKKELLPYNTRFLHKGHISHNNLRVLLFDIFGVFFYMISLNTCTGK